MIEGEYVQQKGPARNYICATEAIKQRTQISPTQRVHLIIIVALAIAVRLYNLWGFNYVLISEHELLTTINAYMNNEFHFSLNPPLVGLLFTAIAKYFKYDLSLDAINVNEPFTTFPYNQIRIVSTICGSLAILFSYKTLRSLGISHFIAMLGCLILMLENSLVTQQRLIAVDGIYIFFLSLFLSFHKTIRFSSSATQWLINVFTSSVALGLVLSSHWSGILVVVYALISSTYDFACSSADVKTPAFTMWSRYLFRIVSYLSIAVSIYLSLYKQHFDTVIRRGDKSYNLLSPEFQSVLENNHLSHSNEFVGYGAKVMLRHHKTGYYLHSHADNYRSSGHQQVTMLDNFDDSNNFFEILPIFGDINKQVDHASSVQPPFVVSFKHILSNSSLVIDPNHKPPLSEQEYNKQVTTDHDFPQEADGKKDRKAFQLRFAADKCKTQESLESLKMADSLFQIYNERESCYLLATSLILNEGYSQGQNEVICISEPNYQASLWFIDWNENAKYDDSNPKFSAREYSFWNKLAEIHQLLLKQLIFGNEYSDSVSEYTTDIIDWITLGRGYTHFFKQGVDRVIYLLGNIIVYYSILVSIFIYLVINAYYALTWNPFNVKISKFDSQLYKYLTESFDHLLGYSVLLISMKFINIDVHLFNYMPALYFGILMLLQALEFLYEKLPKVCYGVLVIFSILTISGFVKFSPLIFGLEWTTAQCHKLMVVPTWDDFFCDSSFK